MNDSSTSIAETEAEVKKPAKEIPIVQDQGIFQQTTGDVYDGFFEAKKKDRTVKMHGPGIYTTAEGDSYAGNWDADRLGGAEEVTISFNDTSRYDGYFKDWCYHGPGNYMFPDSSVLKCDFVENSPVGNLTLIDPNGHTWMGKSEQGYVWVEPVNHFYKMLEKTRDSGRIKRRHKNKGNVQETDQL